MNHLNYHHLRYFWFIAREGSIAKACARLHVTQPTISGQLRELENAMGHSLFDRVGRGLVLTDAGRTAFRFADEIFSLGDELLETMAGRPSGQALKLTVGVADVLPKLVVHRLLAPVLDGPEQIRTVCVEGKVSDLLARLAVHELDVVLSDMPLPPNVSIRAYSHSLGKSSITLFAVPKLARTLRTKLPHSLQAAPFLLPTTGTVSRRLLDQWMEDAGVRPHVVAEFEDSALLKVFGQSGMGVFPASSVIGTEIAEQYGVAPVMTLTGCEEEFFAISMERRLRHPSVQRLIEEARQKLFVQTSLHAHRGKSMPRGTSTSRDHRTAGGLPGLATYDRLSLPPPTFGTDPERPELFVPADRVSTRSPRPRRSR
jgi:LysR family transcriptional activator of nhaA